MGHTGTYFGAFGDSHVLNTSSPGVRMILWLNRHFEPPDGYEPGKSQLPQFALVITNRTFESSKIPDIPKQVKGTTILLMVEAEAHPGA